MIDVRAAVGAVSAWRILKRHPCYREAWLAAADRSARLEGEPVPIRRQTEADLEAAPWGLLAWEDPLDEDGPASPFWADAPMPEGMQGRRETPSFAALVRSQGGGVSGLLLRDGGMILKVERNGMAGQVRIEDGAAFDPAGRLCCKLGEGAMRDQGASCSPYDSALARRSCSHAMASVRAHGQRSKARSTIRASPTMPPWRANIPAWPLRSARITSKPLIVA